MSKKLEQLRITAAGKGSGVISISIEELNQVDNEIDQLRKEGIPVDGYFVWSFLDNLEWVSGFAQRFGLVHVDHSTQVRTIKDSGYWYRDRITTGSANPAG